MSSDNFAAMKVTVEENLFWGLTRRQAVGLGIVVVVTLVIVVYGAWLAILEQPEHGHYVLACRVGARPALTNIYLVDLEEVANNRPRAKQLRPNSKSSYSVDYFTETYDPKAFRLVAAAELLKLDGSIRYGSVHLLNGEDFEVNVEVTDREVTLTLYDNASRKETISRYVASPNAKFVRSEWLANKNREAMSLSLREEYLKIGETKEEVLTLLGPPLSSQPASALTSDDLKDIETGKTHAPPPGSTAVSYETYEGEEEGTDFLWILFDTKGRLIEVWESFSL